MKIICSYDYELFFGIHSGTPEDCLIKPTERLRQIADRHGIKLVFFVDSGYLLKLKELSPQYPELAEARQKILLQLRDLAEAGHELQLHIHSHWEQTEYENGNWRFDHKHYRLQSFEVDQIRAIVEKNMQCITEIAGIRPTVFRAGGWCIQPFEPLAEVFAQNGIRLDSSVVPGMTLKSDTHQVDFTDTPAASFWRYSTNPLRNDKAGEFVEIPMASQWFSPLFFWKTLLVRLLKISYFRGFGNGCAVTAGAKYKLLFMLLKGSTAAISFDGLKGMKAEKGCRRWQHRYGHDAYCVVIGHPKAHCEYSLRCFEKFIRSRIASGDCFTTFHEVSWSNEYKNH